MSDTNREFRLYGLSLVAALGGLLFGFDTAVISGTIPFITEYFALTDATLGWAVSSVIVGAMLGLLVAGRMADKVGRKPVLLFAAALYTISAFATAFSHEFSSFIIARIIGGVAVGTASMVSPLYIAELAPAARRGALVSLNQLTIVIGILIAFFSNYFLLDTGADNWRWMFGAEAVPAIAFFLCLFFVPESPRFLVRVGKIQKARYVLGTVRPAESIETEIREIGEVISGFQQGTLRDLLTPGMRKLLVIGMGLAVFQQVTGINVVMYYAPIIFEQAGSATSDAVLQTIAIGIVNLTFTLVAIRRIDRSGRKPLMIFGSAGMTISLLVLAGLFWTETTAGWFTLIPILTFVASFAASLGPVVWVVISEIFPIRVRGIAMATATFVLWTSNFIVSATFPWLLANLEGGWTFFVYGVLSFCTLGFVLRFVPETRGKSLEMLEKELAGV